MCSAVMIGLGFPYTQESCFDAWKLSHMCCSSLLCDRFADFQESRFQALKRTNMGSAYLEGARPANIHEFCFQAAKRSDMDCVQVQVAYLLKITAHISTFRTVKTLFLSMRKSTFLQDGTALIRTFRS